MEESEDEDQPKSKEKTLQRRLLVVEDEKGKGGKGEGHKWFRGREKRKQTDVVCQSCKVNFLIHDSDNFCRRCGDIYTPVELYLGISSRVLVSPYFSK